MRAQVPLADDARPVPRRLEQLGDRLLGLRETELAIHVKVRDDAGPDAEASGEQGGAADAADRGANMKVGEPDPLAGHLV